MDGFNALLIMNVATERNFEVMSDECSEVLKNLTI
jgi:hypothetical protein